MYGYDLSDDGVFVISCSGPALGILKKGDLITAFGGQKIEKLLDLRLAIFDFDVGDEVQVTFVRNGTTQTAKVVLTSK